MLFSEVHSAYFQAVARILTEAIDAPVSPGRMDEIVRETAFAESVLHVAPALRSGEWPLLTPEGRALVRNMPTMPLTMLEKRWLKALLLDPRVALFDPPSDGLEDIEPLFDPGDVYWFDRYLDGDPYDNPQYIANFRMVLLALRERRKLRIVYTGAKGRTIRGVFMPGNLEYSQKDDKFRLHTLGGKRISIRLSTVLVCEPEEPFSPVAFQRTEPGEQHMLEIEIRDDRNAMERAMLHFSHLKKEAERVGDDRYRMKLWYEQEDETEMVIRVLSFGPMARVLAPEQLKRQVVERLENQVKLM